MIKENIIILNSIRSVHNVGSIFRTADAAGISKIYLVGETPAPIDRFGRERQDFAKVSLGAEKSVGWQQEDDVHNLIENLKKDGFQIIAIEQSPKSVSYKNISLQDKNCFIFGNEVKGLSQDILESAHVIAEIPMRGKKESLNVSVSAGITLFRILDL